MKKFSVPYFLWLVVFVVLPIILVTMMAFTTGDMVEFSTFEFSMENFRRFFDTTYMQILSNSVILAFISTVLCFLIGYPCAYIITKQRPKTKNLLILLFVIPMWMNFLLRTYAWLTLLGNNGIINQALGLIGLGPVNIIYNNSAVLLGMVYNFIPFIVLPIYTVLEKLDKSLIEAAKDLGANDRNVFTRVVFPLSLPGVFSGIIMVFIPAVSTFVISSLLGGNKSMLIGNVIEQQFRFTGDWHFGAAISFVLMVLMLIAMVATSKFSSDKEGNTGLW